MMRAYIVGVRAYYAFKGPHMQGGPISAAKYPIEALLVAVYQTNARADGDYSYHHHHPTYDLIVPVESKREKVGAGDEDDYSIYDITRPCPNLCDETSALYGN